MIVKFLNRFRFAWYGMAISGVIQVLIVVFEIELLENYILTSSIIGTLLLFPIIYKLDKKYFKY